MDAEHRITPAVAYADEVTVMLTSPDDKATGAKFNKKSKALPLGRWKVTTDVMAIHQAD